MVEYNRSYYLTNCGGCEQYQYTKGKILSDILKTTINIADLHPKNRVLDVGCGRGELVLHAVLKGCEAVGIDYSNDAIDIARETILQLPEGLKKNVTLLQMDACKMDFKKESFDRIFLTDVVEHLQDEELKHVFQTCQQLLKDNGRLIIHTAPTLNYLRIGQYFRKLFYCFKLENFQTTSLKYEKDEKGHINIQSKRSLENHLSFFPKVRCWYQLCLSENLIKKVIDKTPFAPYLALNLFAIASKK